MAPVAPPAGRGARARSGGPRRDLGAMMLGMLIGLVLGLVIAVIVAVLVTRAPVPFLNKAGRGPDKALELPPGAVLPDPNKPLDSPGEATRPPIGAAKPGPETTAPVAAQPASGAEADGAEKISYLLQAGAFRNQDDADGVKAKLALIGFEARVVPGEVAGQTLHRVRVGPFATIDQMNKARERLAEAGIEAAAVRQK